MKILLLNIWPEWPSGRRYLDYTADEVWHVCDANGAKYVRNFLGADLIAGMTIVRNDDVGELMEALLKVYAVFPFERVVAVDEFTVLPAAFIRDHFDIPGPRVAQVEPYRNKRRMKECLAEAGIRIARNLDPAQMSNGSFIPCVVKRPDGAAADGVHVCRTEEEFQQHRAALKNGALLEEYVEGDIFHVDGAFNRSAIAAVPHAYINTCYQHYKDALPHGSVEVDEPGLKARLVEFARQVVGALPLPEGIFHLEVIRTPRDELVFLEIACRIGGGEVFTNFADVYNFDLLEFCIASQLGRQPVLKQPRQQDVAGWLMLNSFQHVPGIFTALRCAPLAPDNCMYVLKPFRLGREVMDRARNFVTFAFRGSSTAAVRASIADVAANVTLECIPLPAAAATDSGAPAEESIVTPAQPAAVQVAASL